MNKISIIGIVIIYNFDIDDLLKNINRYLFALDKLVIWQNSSLNHDDEKKIRNIKYSERIEFLGNGENRGISFPINQIINKYSREYNYLMTMDQDSYWINFSDYIKSIYNFENKKQIYIWT